MTIEDLDQWFPPRGPCAFCGHHDARHRLWDTFINHHKAGDSVRLVSRAFEVPYEAVWAVIKVQPYQEELYGSGSR